MQPARDAPPIRWSPPAIGRPEPWLGLGPDLRWLFLANLLWSVGLGLYYFTWPVYAAGLGASPVDIGTLYALSFFLATASSAAGGALADRYDRRALLLWSWLVSVPAPVLWALAPDWRYLIPGIVLFWGSNIGAPAFAAYAITAAPPGRAAFAFSVVTASFPLGMVFSPAAGGMLAERWGMRAVLLLAGLLYAVSTALVLPMRRQPPHRPASLAAGPPGGLRAWWRAGTAPEVRAPVLLAAAGAAVLNLSLPFAPTLLTEVGGHGLSAVGWMGTAAAAGAVLASPALGSLADRAGPGPAVAAALVLLAGHGLAVVTWPGGLPILGVAFAGRGVMEATRAVLAHATGRAAPRGTMGRALAVFDVAAGLAGMAAAWAGGWLYRADPRWPFWATAAIALLLVPAALRLRRSAGGSPPDPAPAGSAGPARSGRGWPGRRESAR